MELQKYFSKFLLKNRKRKLTERDYFLSTELSRMLGTEVQNVALYREAFSLKNSSKNQDSNYERLEFLGDSVLGTIISCHLFQTYPQANEGYLTQMKSKIVNRKNLNKLGEDLKLTDLLQKSGSVALGENISGNLFEALIGAVYLDFQYDACKKIILERLLTPTEINKLENKIVS
jgi:ribonuclease-3